MLHYCQIWSYQSLLPPLCTGAVRCFPLSCRVELPARGDVSCSNPADVLPVCPHPASALTTGCTGTQQVFWRAARCSSLSLVWITDQISDKGRAIVPGRICTDKLCSLVLLLGYFAATCICTDFLPKSVFGQFFFFVLKVWEIKLVPTYAIQFTMALLLIEQPQHSAEKESSVWEEKAFAKAFALPFLKVNLFWMLF